MVKVVIGRVINRISKALPVGANRAASIFIANTNITPYW